MSYESQERRLNRLLGGAAYSDDRFTEGLLTPPGVTVGRFQQRVVAARAEVVYTQALAVSGAFWIGHGHDARIGDFIEEAP